MRKRIIICCDDSIEADYIKKETEQINQDSQNKIKAFSIDTPNLTRLKAFLDKLPERIADVTAFRIYCNEALDELLSKGDLEPDIRVVKRIKKEFASIRARDLKTIVEKTKKLTEKHELNYKKEEAYEVYDIFHIDTVTNYNDLHLNISDADGLVVPCELTWNHEGSGFNADDYKGIALVQYLRSNKNGITLPIIFTSDKNKDDIIKKKKDAEIIRTPALQHRFINNMQANYFDAVLKTFKDMRKLNDAELKYTQLQYCDLKGLLITIKHAIKSNLHNTSIYKERIEYILAQDFNNQESVLKKYKQTKDKDLEEFCNYLISLYENKNDLVEKNDEFIIKNDEKTIKVLYLEDNISDENAARFKTFIEDHQKLNKKFRFKIKQIDNPDECYEIYNNYDVIIADIEILNKNKELIALGSEVVKNLIKKGAQKLFYIVSNVTRSFYDQIKIPGINRIRLKQEVFGSDEKITTFLYGIKEAIDHKSDEDTKYKRVFDKLYAYINNNGNYPIEYRFKSGDKNDVLNYDELENVIKEKSLDLIKKFLGICYNYQEDLSNDNTERFGAFDDVCYVMQEYVGKNIGKGESKLIGKIIKQDNDNETTNPESIRTFITRLVLRRFYTFVREFVLHYNIKAAGDEYYNADISYVTVSDLACRVINGAKGAYKKYVGEKDISTPNQSKCLSGALMLSENEDEMSQLLDKEELALINAVKNQRDSVFDYTSMDKIDNLVIDY